MMSMPEESMELVVINRPYVLPYRQMHQIAKRIMDLTLCLLAMPVVLPVMSFLALLIRLDSPGPALFVQERVGKGGRAFRMFKFRTMPHNLDDTFHRAFMKAFVRGEIGSEAGTDGGNNRFQGAFIKVFLGSLSKTNGNNGKVFKPAQASQITWLGNILRRTSLDELPQIFNVLKGEMSLVGPRPNVPWEVEEYLPWHYERLEVLPGLTGLAQVKGRSGLSFDTIVKYDIEYIEKQSPWMDLQVLWWTLSAVFYGTGAE
jgi:lipopolysaccharide/colanic/teichoic acid biosynthesis glycosyltransferase